MRKTVSESLIYGAVFETKVTQRFVNSVNCINGISTRRFPPVLSIIWLLSSKIRNVKKRNQYSPIEKEMLQALFAAEGTKTDHFRKNINLQSKPFHDGSGQDASQAT